MWSGSLTFGRERRMSQRFCTSRRSIFRVFSRFRCTFQLKLPIFKMSTTSQCFSAVFFCWYCDWNIKDFVIVLNFPNSKVKNLDLLRFERVSSLFSASFFFASFLLCFSALLSC